MLLEINKILDDLNIPCFLSKFPDKPPDEYVIITPMNDEYDDFADDCPNFDTQNVRISLFSRGMYLITKKKLEKVFIKNGFDVTNRQYVGRDSSNFHNIAIDISKTYFINKIMEGKT